MSKVRELRLDRLMTQADLAKKSKVALRTISNVEKGRKCHMTTKRRLLEALEVPFERWREIFQ